MQLASHDGLFAPKPRRAFFQKLVPAITLTLFLISFSSPSFQIAQFKFQRPPFPVPNRLAASQFFTLPGDSGLLNPRLAGRPLGKIESPRPLYFGSSGSPGQKILSFGYQSARSRPSSERWRPRFEHPVVSIFTKHVIFEAVSFGENSQKSEREVASLTAGSKGQGPKIDKDVYDRIDGAMAAACWKLPERVEIEREKTPIPLSPKRTLESLAALTAAGPGEVIFIGPSSESEKSILLYHGGGLLSRYFNIHEYRVRKGDRVAAGQEIAIVISNSSAKSSRSPSSVTWDVRWGNEVINPESFLEWSSQLCDSK